MIENDANAKAPMAVERSLVTLTQRTFDLHNDVKELRKLILSQVEVTTESDDTLTRHVKRLEAYVNAQLVNIIEKFRRLELRVAALEGREE